MAYVPPGALPGNAPIDRPRLRTRIGRRFQTRLTTVVGGAGAGKTTLLTQAMAAENDGLDVWYPCGPSDRSTRRFRAGLLTATRRDLGVDPVIDADGGDGDPIDQIADHVLAASPRQVCILIDDVQLLAGGHVLDELLEALPTTGHLVLSGRRIPPISAARLDAHGECERLDQVDLMMTDDELVAFANLRGVDVELLRNSDGWPAFAELATRSSGAGTREYLEQEALRTLDATRRQHLAAFAWIGGGDDVVARAVTGLGIDDLLQALPLVRWAGDWAQLHDLWSDLLADELSDDERRDAAISAAEVARQAQDIDRAIDLCVRSSAWTALLTTLEHAVRDGVVGGLRPALLDRWLSTIPAARRDAPIARLLVGLIERERDPTADAPMTALDEAAEGFRRAGSPELELVALSQLGYVARITGIPQQVEWVRDRIGRLAETHAEAGPFVHLCDAWIALTEGRPDIQLAALQRIDDAQLPLVWRATREHLIAHALMNLGRPHEALTAVPSDIETRRLAIPGALATELQCRWHAGRPDLAYTSLPEGLGVDYGARDRFVTNAFLAMTRAFAGDTQSARRLVAAAELGAGSLPGALVAAQLAGVKMVIAIVDGRESDARAALEAILDRLSLETGVAQQLLRNVLALPYVLVPETRRHWHEATLGASMVRTRELAAAFVAAREAADLGPIGSLTWPDPGFIATALPLPWAAEFAVHGVRAQRYEAFHLAGWLCERWGRPARDAIAARSDDDRLGAAALDLLHRTPAPPDHPVELGMLGETRLLINGTATADPDWRRERVRAVLAWLVIHPTTSRHQIAAGLWPDLGAARAAKNLRTTLNYLHRVLEPQRSSGEAPWFVRADGSHVYMHSSLDVDVWRFRLLLDRADEAERRGRPSEALPLLTEAAGLWRGDLAADLDYEWLELERIHLRGRYVRAACRAAELLVATGRGSRAVEVVRPALSVDPWYLRAYEALATGYRSIDDETSARAVEGRAAAQRRALADDDLSDLGPVR